MGWRASFGVRGIQVMLNGIPLTSPDGQTILEVIDPNMIRSAEIISRSERRVLGQRQRRHGLPSHRHCRRGNVLAGTTRAVMAATGRISPRLTTLAKHGFRLTCPPFRPMATRNHSRARLNRTSLQLTRTLDAPQHAFFTPASRPMRPTRKPPVPWTCKNHTRRPGNGPTPCSFNAMPEKDYTHIMQGVRYTRETEGQRFETVISAPCVICAIPSSPPSLKLTASVPEAASIIR